jgi:hypothetical protein
MTELTPRQPIYDLYWYFAAERQAIYERRLTGDPGPWTADPILQTYKFCNVFRATDRVSQYLIRSVAYADPDAQPSDILFRIVAFRFFSRITTWDSIIAYLGRQPIIADLADGRLEHAINSALEANGKLYTGAFILCANRAYGFQTKYQNHLALFRHMFMSDSLADQLFGARSLEEIYTLLRSYPLMGDFMSYQIAIDLNYSDHLNFSENDFTKAGPGAQRGIKKVFSSTGSLSPAEVINWMVEHQGDEFSRLGLSFKGLFGRKLHAIDCQGLFCEVDKYCREAAPDLASARTQIKARHTPSAEPIAYFFPPKWGLAYTLPTAPLNVA